MLFTADIVIAKLPGLVFVHQMLMRLIINDACMMRLAIVRELGITEGVCASVRFELGWVHLQQQIPKNQLSPSAALTVEHLNSTNLG